MKVQIGRRYYEERERLVDSINNGNSEVIKTRAERNRCYLCRSRIVTWAKMRVVVIEGSVSRESIGYRFLHEGCYRSVLSRQLFN